MEFLGKLGIDIKLLIAQMINFGLLLWLLAKFLYQPIIKRIEKDEAELKQAQTKAQDLEKQQKVFMEQKKLDLTAANSKAREIIKEAENIAQEIKKQAQNEATEEKQAVIKQIRSRLIDIENAEKSK